MWSCGDDGLLEVLPQSSGTLVPSLLICRTKLAELGVFPLCDGLF